MVPDLVVELVGEGVDVELGHLFTEDRDVLVHQAACDAPPVLRDQLLLAPAAPSPEHAGSLPRHPVRLREVVGPL